MAYTIYLRTNKINGKQYVGQTGNFRRRENKWKRLEQPYGSEYFNKEREKYGLENFNVVIIDHCETQEEAYDLEEKYIKELGTKYPNGYNMSDGGAGAKGVKLTEEAKKKISESKKGKYAGENAYWYVKKRPDVSEKKKKPILQIDRITSEVIREWDCAIDAEETTNINRSCICECCKGRQKTAGGYKWKYAEE